MRSRRAVSVSGVNLLKNPAIQRGQAQSSSSENAIHTAHAISHQRAPLACIVQSTRATTPPPSNPPSATDLSRSTTNTAGVVRLKPKRASSTNVRQTENGSETRLIANSASSTCTRSGPDRVRASDRSCEPTEGRDTAPQRQDQQDDCVEGQFQPAEALPRDRVIGCLRMLDCADRIGEGGRDFVPVCGDVACLPERQPELHDEVQA